MTCSESARGGFSSVVRRITIYARDGSMCRVASWTGSSSRVTIAYWVIGLAGCSVLLGLGLYAILDTRSVERELRELPPACYSGFATMITASFFPSFVGADRRELVRARRPSRTPVDGYLIIDRAGVRFQSRRARWSAFSWAAPWPEIQQAVERETRSLYRSYLDLTFGDGSTLSVLTSRANLSSGLEVARHHAHGEDAAP